MGECAVKKFRKWKWDAALPICLQMMILWLLILCASPLMLCAVPSYHREPIAARCADVCVMMTVAANSVRYC